LRDSFQLLNVFIFLLDNRLIGKTGFKLEFDSSPPFQELSDMKFSKLIADIRTNPDVRSRFDCGEACDISTSAKERMNNSFGMPGAPVTLAVLLRTATSSLASSATSK